MPRAMEPIATRGTLHLPAEEPVTDTMLEDSREFSAFLEVMRAKLNRRVPGITEAFFPILKGAHRPIFKEGILPLTLAIFYFHRTRLSLTLCFPPILIHLVWIPALLLCTGALV